MWISVVYKTFLCRISITHIHRLRAIIVLSISNGMNIIVLCYCQKCFLLFLKSNMKGEKEAKNNFGSVGI